MKGCVSEPSFRYGNVAAYREIYTIIVAVNYFERVASVLIYTFKLF